MLFEYVVAKTLIIVSRIVVLAVGYSAGALIQSQEATRLVDAMRSVAGGIVVNGSW